MDDVSTLYHFPDYKNVGEHYGAYAKKYDKIMNEIEFFEAQWLSEQCQLLPELKHMIGNQEAILLDVACGTGNSGKELIKRGFIPTYGLDASR